VCQGVGCRVDRLLNLRATTSQKCEAVPRRARIEGSLTCVSLNSKLGSIKKKKKVYRVPSDGVGNHLLERDRAPGRQDTQRR